MIKFTFRQLVYMKSKLTLIFWPVYVTTYMRPQADHDALMHTMQSRYSALEN